MAWKDVCVRGNPIGGKVREDDPHGTDPLLHDAGGPSPGIEKLIREVVRMTPMTNTPAKPADFPTWVYVETYPGRGGPDVHFEGRAADVYLNVDKPNEKVWGDWLFDWCVANCTIHKVQGVIFGRRVWFSEMDHGVEQVYKKGDHNGHVHLELNCDGASLGAPPPPPPAGLVGTWDATIGTWSGIFVFGSDRSVSWANDERSRHTGGSWTSDGGNLYFQFHDAGDFRVFQATLPVNAAKTKGSILPSGQGWFEMTKKP
jgi:hypothetical protein